MQPSIGRIVHYTLAEGDAQAINKRRADFEAFRSNFSGPSRPGTSGADGHVAHIGNRVQAGQSYPAMVVRVFDPTVTTANLQVFLDGNDTSWVTSSTEGEGPGHWVWPPRV